MMRNSNAFVGLLRAAPFLALVNCTAVLMAQDVGSGAQFVSLKDCIEKALVHNRALQIERINPEIAQLTLSGSYGYYDPSFVSRFEWQEAADTGGFDPVDFSRDTIYSATSEIASAGLTGALPSGMTYDLSAGYAHSDGIRNAFLFDSYRLVSAISARQPLLKDFWTDKGRTQIRINKKYLRISELGVSYVMMDTINQVQQAYFELLFSVEDLQVFQGLLQAKQETLRGIRRQVEVGTMTALDESLARSQAARVQAELVAASNTVVRAANALKTLLGQTAAEWNDRPMLPADRLLVVPQTLNLRESWQAGVTLRPDLAQMVQDLERADIDVKFRRNQLYPSLDFVGSYGRRGSSAIQSNNAPPDASLSTAWEQIDDAAAPSYGVGVVFSTPLSRSKERASYRASKQSMEQARLRLNQKEELILREISDAFHSAQSAFDRAGATRHAREEAKAALEAEKQKLEIGTSSLFFVLQLQSDLAATESAEVRARADYNKALSQLHFSEGTLLDKNKVIVEFR